MDSSFNSEVSHVLEPIQSNALSLNDCFTVNIQYTHLTIFSPSNDPKNLIFKLITPVFNKFEIPYGILCNNNDTNNQSLYKTFYPIPSFMIDSVLDGMRDSARKMVLFENFEEMNVCLRRVTSHIGREDQIDQYHPYQNDQQTVGLSSNMNVDIASDFKDRCSICFEEFRNGSQTNLFYTKCSHIFHKKCIAKWIYQCVNNGIFYSCPLCRSEMM